MAQRRTKINYSLMNFPKEVLLKLRKIVDDSQETIDPKDQYFSVEHFVQRSVYAGIALWEKDHGEIVLESE